VFGDALLVNAAWPDILRLRDERDHFVVLILPEASADIIPAGTRKTMSGHTLSILKKTLLAMACGIIGSLVTLILVVVFILENRPDLKVWHTAHLDGQYTAASPVANLEEYLALESRLFQQMEQQVLDRITPADRVALNRYHRGSLTDPARWDINWNRTFEMDAARPAAGVLLLHGMSDSPYSLRALGQRLNAKGAWVLGLRLPGHGTVPSGLVRLKWEDMAAAVRLAVRHISDRVGDKPVFLVGYSTGAALAVGYALDQFNDGTLPPVEKMVLISPAMGVSRLAALSVWQARLGRWLGLEKLAWNSILPEYNTYKYSSFAINAGDQVHRLAANIRTGLNAAHKSEALSRFPPVLTFQSVVDATVSASAVFTGLYHYLDSPDNELVVFDINRQTGVSGLLGTDPLSRIQDLRKAADSNYAFSLLTNEDPASRRVVVHSSDGDAPDPSDEPLPWLWPKGVHSLSHIALPFPADDPLYGVADSPVKTGIRLSKITLRGEKGVVNIPAAEVLRLRWNPFYPYLEQRVLSFLWPRANAGN